MERGPKKQLKDLNLMDRFLFAEVMEDTGAYQSALEIILDKEIRLKENVQSEKEVRTLPSFRGIRLDVWGEDEEDTVYNSEMQGENTKNLPRRSRFYQSVMDAGLLKPGVVDFNTLKDVWLITIAPFDLFGEGRYRYTFRMRCDESPELRLGDGAARMFLNTKGKIKEGISEELQAFLRYVEDSKEDVIEACGSERLKKIHEQVSRVKSNEVSEVKYMQFWEEMVMERQKGEARGETVGFKKGETLGLKKGEALGLKKGEALGLKRGETLGLKKGETVKIISLVRKKQLKGMDAETIADALEESPEFVNRILNVLQSNPEAADEEIFEKVK